MTNQQTQHRIALILDIEKEENTISEEDLTWLENVEQKVLEGITQFDFSIETLAITLMTNRWQLGERLKAVTGLTINKYIQEIRLNHARNLLENGEVDSIKRLASHIGMKDMQYFSRLFKKRFGRNPSSFL